MHKLGNGSKIELEPKSVMNSLEQRRTVESKSHNETKDGTNKEDIERRGFVNRRKRDRDHQGESPESTHKRKTERKSRGGKEGGGVRATEIGWIRYKDP